MTVQTQPEPEALPVTGALVIRPGDVLVVAMASEYLTAEQADGMKRQLMTRLPGLADVVLITRTTALAAYRTEKADEAQD